MPPIPVRPPRILPDLARGNGCAALGDSITQSNADIDNGISGSTSWFVRACMASGQRIRYVRNAGISGDTTTGMLARMDDDVIAYRPDRCFVLAGTNDIGGGVIPLATTRDNLIAIYRRLRGARIEPILCTLTPRQASPDRISTVNKLNAWIRWYAQSQGFALVDLALATTDEATGLWKTGYSGDETHPSNSGNEAMANQVITDVGAYFVQGKPYLDLYPKLSAGAANLLQRGWFELDSNADGLSDGWTLTSATGINRSRVQTSGIFGYEQVLEYTTSGLRYITANAFSGSWAVGDKLAFSGRFTTIAGTAITGTATAGGASSLTDSGASWTANAFNQGFISITGGTGEGQTIEILSNTDTAVTTGFPWTTPPDATSEYSIVPSLTITARMVFNGAAGTPSISPVYQFSDIAENYVWYQETTVPTGTTNVECQLSAGSGIGTVKWSQPTIVNMTALGMVE